MLVSFVCPTYNRTKYLPVAIRCFLQQTHVEKELIIVDDGSETITLPADGRILHIKLEQRTTTGTKRNIGAEAANGEIIAHLDDDDWSHPHRVEDQLKRLIDSGKAVTGYNQTIRYEEASKTLYDNPAGPPYLASGTSQCYWKSWWKQHPFPDARLGEDSYFSREARLADQLAVPISVGKMMVVRKHSSNTADVFLGRSRRMDVSEVSEEFFWAVENPQPTLEYMRRPHICGAICREDIQLQISRPTVEYKTDFIREIKLV